MPRLLIVVLVLLAAGYGVGRWRGAVRERASRLPGVARGPTVLAWIAGLLIGFPVAAIMLAKLFDSAVLGWMFGLSLIAELLLVPCSIVFAIGYAVGARSTRGAAARASSETLDRPTLSIRIDRDCVHASDEGDARIIAADSRSTLGMLLQQLHESAYLPSIGGGEATWIVTTSTAATPVGVVAQQWPGVRLAAADESLGSHFPGAEPSIRFDYRGRCAPESALDAHRPRVGFDA